MDKSIITFSANEQNLQKTGGIGCYASDTVSYIEAQFALGDNWSGYDSIRAVWFNDYKTISTVLDSDGVCIVPHEVLVSRGKVMVNLVGSVLVSDELSDRLTTFPCEALKVSAKAKISGSETAVVTPSQFEQFVNIVISEVEKVTGMTAQAETLPAGSQATARYENGILYLGIPQGIRGERGETGADGADGNGIASVVYNADYSLTLIFDNGERFTTPPIRGERGPAGADGRDGTDGRDGVDGVTPSLSVGTVTTLPSTEDAYVTRTGTDENPVFNFGIPQGPKGDPGDVSQEQLDAAVSDLKSDITDIENDDELNRIIASLHTPFSGYTFTDVNGDVTQVLYDSSYYACPIVIDAKTVRFDLSRTKQKYIALAWTYNSYQRTIFIDLRDNFYGRLSTVYGASSYNYQALAGFPQLDLSNVIVTNNGGGAYTISDGVNSFSFDITETSVYTDTYAPWNFDIGFLISKDANSSPYLGYYEIETQAINKIQEMINKDGAISKTKGREIQSDLVWYRGYYNASGAWVSDTTYYSAELSVDAFSVCSKSPNTAFIITAFNGTDFVGYWSVYGEYTKYGITNDAQMFFFTEVPDDGYKHIITLHHIDGSTIGAYDDIIIYASDEQNYKAVTDRDGDYYKVAITPDVNNVIYTVGFNYVKMDGTDLHLSKDGGKTFGGALDISGLAENRIIRMRLWENGTFNIFTPTKIYYTDDWTTLYESSIFEADGTTPFVPEGIASFTSPYFDDKRMFVDDTEVYLFGNTPYNESLDGTSRVCLYYSVDNGHTYKIAYEFNVEGALQARHIHFAKYIEQKGVYWVATGDDPTNCHLLSAEYSKTLDEWTFTELGSGINYKWVGCDFWRDTLYYTYDNTPGKVMRCNIEDVTDITKHECILEGLPNDPIGLFIGNHGDMLVTLMNARSGSTPSPFTGVTDAKRMYYSKDRIKFCEIRGYVPYGAPIAGDYYCFSGVNADGRILAIVNNGGDWRNTKLNGVTVWLDDYVRMAGYLGGFRK